MLDEEVLHAGHATFGERFVELFRTAFVSVTLQGQVSIRLEPKIRLEVVGQSGECSLLAGHQPAARILRRRLGSRKVNAVQRQAMFKFCLRLWRRILDVDLSGSLRGQSTRISASCPNGDSAG